jgi:TRAP-type transport system periplasmic protein
MNTRRHLIAATLAAAATAFTALPAAAQMELKLGHVGGPGSLFELSANEFARRANEKLGNKAKVVVFGSSQLGGDRELMQKLRLGTVEFAIPSTVMSSEVDAFGMFEMPYLVKNREHMKRSRPRSSGPRCAPGRGQGLQAAGGVGERLPPHHQQPPDRASRRTSRA